MKDRMYSHLKIIEDNKNAILALQLPIFNKVNELFGKDVAILLDGETEYVKGRIVSIFIDDIDFRWIKLRYRIDNEVFFAHYRLCDIKEIKGTNEA